MGHQKHIIFISVVHSFPKLRFVCILFFHFPSIFLFSLSLCVCVRERERRGVRGGVQIPHTFKTSVGFVSAVASAPETAPDKNLNAKLDEPKTCSHACLHGSYKPNLRPPYRSDLVKAGVIPRYREPGPSTFIICVNNCPYMFQGNILHINLNNQKHYTLVIFEFRLSGI
jgi:hypothetical protein